MFRVPPMVGQKRQFQPSCVIDAREWAQHNMRIQKRQKKLSPREESELEPILMTVLGRLTQQSPPQTLEELQELLQDLHSLRLQVDPKVVFYHLLLNGALVLDETNSFILPNTNYSLNTAFRGIVPDEPTIPTHLPFSPYFCDAFLRAALWIQKLPAPLSIQSLFLQLSELCKFEREVSTSQIINLLLHKNYVSLSSTIGGEEILTFSFPSPKALGVTCHYPPLVEVNWTNTFCNNGIDKIPHL